MSLNEKFGVKTPMGVERFEAHFWALFSTDHEVASSDRKVFPNRPKKINLNRASDGRFCTIYLTDLIDIRVVKTQPINVRSISE